MRSASERAYLPDVTLVAVTSVALAPTVDALRASMSQADFGEVLLLSDERPTGGPSEITWRRIDRLASRAAYSHFMLHDLAEHVSTSHALCIQWDGFVLNGSAWSSEFLAYDYIGAPWPHFHDHYNVGNGGFSLRSQPLLKACRGLSFDPRDGEDVIICRLKRSELEEQGMRFAPDPVARQFAYERTPPAGDEFGFHGIFNLVNHVSNSEALRLLGSLEPAMLARNERWELLRWALVHGRPKLAIAMVRRLTRSEFSK